jgi:hypothetical protein
MGGNSNPKRISLFPKHPKVTKSDPKALPKITKLEQMG